MDSEILMIYFLIPIRQPMWQLCFTSHSYLSTSLCSFGSIRLASFSYGNHSLRSSKPSDEVLLGVSCTAPDGEPGDDRYVLPSLTYCFRFLVHEINGKEQLIELPSFGEMSTVSLPKPVRTQLNASATCKYVNDIAHKIQFRQLPLHHVSP